MSLDSRPENGYPRALPAAQCQQESRKDTQEHTVTAGLPSRAIFTRGQRKKLHDPRYR
jgi:hypothetical protein